MVRKQLYIDQDLNDGLRALAARSGRSEADHVRAALGEYLERQRADSGPGDPLLDLIGLVEEPAGPTDVAVEHDRYLYGDRAG